MTVMVYNHKMYFSGKLQISQIKQKRQQASITKWHVCYGWTYLITNVNNGQDHEGTNIYRINHPVLITRSSVQLIWAKKKKSAKLWFSSKRPCTFTEMTKA